METASIKLKEKVATIQNAHEEATALEMPTMTMNLPIIATIVTLGTLTALFDPPEVFAFAIIISLYFLILP